MTAGPDIRNWTVSQVGTWLHSIDLGELAHIFASNAVDGAAFALICHRWVKRSDEEVSFGPRIGA